MLTQIILVFVLGVILLQHQAELPELTWVLGLLPIAVTAWFLRQQQSFFSAATGKILLLFFFLGVGFFWSAALAQWRLADFLPQEWERRDIQVVGVVASLPHSNDRSVRFQFDVEQVLTTDAVVPKRIVLSWYGSRDASDDGIKLPVINVGERWQITVRLKRPNSNANPHGFDYEAWMLERNIRATGYVRQSIDNQRMYSMVNHSGYWVQHLRQEIQQRFTNNLLNEAYVGVLKTLATGDQRAIPREQWRVFTRTGTNHLMAISGLHITLVSSLIFALIFWLWRCSSLLTLYLPARRAAVLVGLMAALAYALLSGFAIPAQRAFYMLAVVAIAIWRGRLTSAVSILAWALLVVVLIDPWAVLSPGFWLSFGAIAIIMFVTVGRIGQVHWVSGWLRVQWAITLGLAPLLLALFQQVSLVSPIANAIAIPLVSLVIVPLTLLGTIPLFDFILPVAHVVLSVGMTALHWLSELPQAVWQQHVPPAWTVFIAVVGIIWMLLPGGLGLGFFAGFPARWLGVFAILPMFLVPPPKPAVGELWLTVMDVGQGLAVLARTKNHALLFDTGLNFGESNSGDRVILPYLRGEGINRLDTMIVSHADSDHSGGALSILDALPVKVVLSSLEENHPIQQAAARKGQCHNDQSWQWDGVQFDLLHPLAQSYENIQRKTNAQSCVLKITS
ncbi:MAG: DNA internalization-related competence protein ComEC/Rec2, partial [Nitrosomonas sp.]|nr:DNA internalization-related competence protein ComEC/Rec2 [Nitrosomonas sp.]